MRSGALIDEPLSRGVPSDSATDTRSAAVFARVRARKVGPFGHIRGTVDFHSPRRAAPTVVPGA